MHRFCFGLLLGVSLLGSARAGDDLVSLFDAKVHDFGNVPIGPLLSHEFTLKNTTKSTLHIYNVRVSCGCVAAQAKDATIEPGKSTTIYASMDTRRFNGSKTVTVFVSFDQPRYEEAALTVTAYSRGDISMSPDTLAFGQIRRGSAPLAETEVSLLSGMKITGVVAESGYVEVVSKETTPGKFVLTAKLRPDLPIGKWYTDVWVTTTQNGKSAKIRLPLTVEVEPGLLASPSLLQFDAVAGGEPVKKSVTIRASQPFKIIGIEGGDGVFKAAASTKDAKPVHILTVYFKPGKEGEFSSALKVLTDLKDESKIEVKVSGTGMKD
jgi:hypothetical protein